MFSKISNDILLKGEYFQLGYSFLATLLDYSENLMITDKNVMAYEISCKL